MTYEFLCWHFSTSCLAYRGQKSFIPFLDDLGSLELDAKFIAVTLRHVYISSFLSINKKWSWGKDCGLSPRSRGGTSHGSARISARAGSSWACSARSSSKIMGENSARLARARKFLMRFWLGSLELGDLSGLARLVFRAKKRAKIKPKFSSFWLVFG